MRGFGLRKKLAVFRGDVRHFIKNRFGRPNLFDLDTPERIGSVYYEPSDMCETDRVMLYALVRGLRPTYAIEIGARWGGAARIIANAMQENNLGRIVGIDPEPRVFKAKPKELHGRYTLFEGYSPAAIPDAVRLLGNVKIDFVLIDALHTHDAVLADFLGCLPYLAEGAHVLLHDTYHQGIDRAVALVVGEHENLYDLGFLTRNPSINPLVAYQGLRLVRFGKVDGKSHIIEAYERNRLPVPLFHEALRNYDNFANRVGLGATTDEINTINKLIGDR